MTRTNRRRDDQGVVALMLALSMVIVVALLAVAVDLGFARSERAHVQATADDAALAAAYASCVEGASDVVAQTRGEAVAARNGFADVVVTPTAGLPRLWTVTVATTTSAPYAAAATDSETTTITSQATAEAECEPQATIPGDQLPAIYADGTCETSSLEKALKIDGNDNVINGDLHSNNDILWSGNTTRVNGSVHAETRLNISGSGNYIAEDVSYGTLSGTLTAGAPASGQNKYGGTRFIGQSDIVPWPKDWSPLLFRVGGTARLDPNFRNVGTGSFQSYVQSLPGYTANTIPAGIYYSTADTVVIPENWRSAAGGVTIVADREGTDKGTIEVGKNVQLTPYFDGLLLASYGTKSGSPCDFQGVKLSGDNSGNTIPVELTGNIYVPNGQIHVGGNYYTTLGSWISRAYYISGNNHTVSASPAPTQTTPPRVRIRS